MNNFEKVKSQWAKLKMEWAIAHLPSPGCATASDKYKGEFLTIIRRKVQTTR
jgi:hypothetical protein